MSRFLSPTCKVFVASLCAGLLSLPALAACAGTSGTVIGASLAANEGTGATSAELRLLPGGIAEYTAAGLCSVLGLTALQEGAAIYTDDGLGRSLTVAVGADRSFVVTHVSGWTSTSR